MLIYFEPESKQSRHRIDSLTRGLPCIRLVMKMKHGLIDLLYRTSCGDDSPVHQLVHHYLRRNDTRKSLSYYCCYWWNDFKINVVIFFARHIIYCMFTLVIGTHPLQILPPARAENERTKHNKAYNNSNQLNSTNHKHSPRIIIYESPAVAASASTSSSTFLTSSSLRIL